MLRTETSGMDLEIGVYSVPSEARIPIGEPDATHFLMQAFVSDVVAAAALGFRSKQAISRTYPVTTPGVPSYSGSTLLVWACDVW
jgi:hypothetical protein